MLVSGLVDLGAVIVRLPRFPTTVMIPDAVLELSVEQLINTLNEKLSIECTGVPTKSPVSRVLVAALTARVRFNV